MPDINGSIAPMLPQQGRVLLAEKPPAPSVMAEKLNEVIDNVAQAAIQAEPVASGLLAYVKQCFTDAQSAKNSNQIVDGLSITSMMLEAQDRRNGVHTAKMKKMIEENGLPSFYQPITDMKCRDGLAWWHDATVAFGDDWFRCEPTHDPEVPEELKAQITQQLLMDAQMHIQMGGAPPSEDDVRKAVDEAISKAHEDIVREAEERAKKMELKIKDQFQDFDFNNLRDKFRLDLLTFGTAFYWGPYIKTIKVPVWRDGIRIVEELQKPWCDVVSPLDIFPAPWMTETSDHGYICRRMKIVPDELRAFKGLPGWRDEDIDALITNKTESPPKEIIQGDDKVAVQQGKDQMTDKRGDFIWMVGYIPGSKLKGMGDEFAEDTREYFVHVCWMGEHLLCVRTHLTQMEVIPCYKAVYEEVPGSFWGIGIPMKMRPSQDKANAIVIPMLDNIGWAAGGITEVDAYRSVDPSALAKWAPRMIVKLKEPVVPTTLPAIRHTVIPLRSQELSELLKETSLEADEQSGIRKYSLGSDKAAGAGRTYQGLAMLMDASSKTLKSAMYRGDKAEALLIEAMADFNNEHGSDDIKGDIKIITSGATGFFVRDIQMQQLEHMIDRLMNPTLINIIGPEQLIALIRDLGTRLRVNMRYIPTDKEIEQKIEQIKQQAMMQKQGGGENTAGTPPNPENEKATPAGVM